MRTTRIKRFLHSLASAAEELNEKQRKKLSDIISSDAGAELLAEYADSVVRTSSQTAIAGLALLYADVNEERYSRDFKASACLSLQGISENLIEIFLQLSRAPEVATPIEGVYPVVICNQALVDNLPELGKLLAKPEQRIAYVNELIRRGFFLPDYATRYGGSEVVCHFGISDTTLKFQELLLRAKQYVAGVDWRGS
jgi:hypothetical protein